MYPLLTHIIPQEVEHLAGLLLEGAKAKEIAIADQPLSKLGDYLDAPGMDELKALYCLILHSLELNQVPDLFDHTLNELAKEEEEPTPEIFSHPRARDFYATFLFFNQPASRLPVPEECAKKCATQNYCFAVESEMVFKIESALKKIWQTRSELLGTFLEMKDGRLTFHSEFSQFLHKTLERYPMLSFGGSFEDPVFLNTFRYVLQISDAKDFRPNLAEAGLILLALHAQLGAEGISESEITELSLRFFRLHKLKLKSVSVHTGFDENLWEIFLADRDRTLELLKNLHFAKPDDMREVA